MCSKQNVEHGQKKKNLIIPYILFNFFLQNCGLVCPIEAKARNKAVTKKKKADDDEMRQKESESESGEESDFDFLWDDRPPSLLLKGEEEKGEREEEDQQSSIEQRVADANAAWKRAYHDEEEEEDEDWEKLEGSDVRNRGGKMRKTVSFSSAECWRQVSKHPNQYS